MGDDIRCHRGGGVSKDHYDQTLAQARRVFQRGKNLVSDQEVKKAKGGLIKRAELVCQQSKNDHPWCAGGVKTVGEAQVILNGIAESIASHLEPPDSSSRVRLTQNLSRLFRSSRVSDEQVAEAARLYSLDREEITAFRNMMKGILSAQHLAAFDHYPHEGAVFCFLGDPDSS